MLTKQFYYNIYKPYYLGVTEDVGRHNEEYLKRLEMQYTNSFYITFNVSNKQEVLEHARNVSISINELRYALKVILRDMNDPLMDLSLHFNIFAKSYNRSIQFMANQIHCEALKVFAKRIRRYMRKNRKFLLSLKLRMKKGRIIFMPKAFSKLTEEEIQQGITVNKRLFASLYKGMETILVYPLAVHMQFNDKKLYNNYEIGFTEKNGQVLVESGILVDKTF